MRPPTKPELRRRLKEALRLVDRAAESQRIRARLAPLVPAAGAVLAFEPLADEPDIGPLVELLRREGRLVLVAGPRDNPVLAPTVTPALALVPGRAFDRRGCRLGRGGGTFDRILGRLSCPKIGVAFDCQLVDRLPAEPHDERVDRLITASFDLEFER